MKIVCDKLWDFCSCKEMHKIYVSRSIFYTFRYNTENKATDIKKKNSRTSSSFFSFLLLHRNQIGIL